MAKGTSIQQAILTDCYDKITVQNQIKFKSDNNSDILCFQQDNDQVVNPFPLFLSCLLKTKQK